MTGRIVCCVGLRQLAPRPDILSDSEGTFQFCSNEAVAFFVSEKKDRLCWQKAFEQGLFIVNPWINLDGHLSLRWLDSSHVFGVCQQHIGRVDGDVLEKHGLREISRSEVVMREVMSL